MTVQGSQNNLDTQVQTVLNDFSVDYLFEVLYQLEPVIGAARVNQTLDLLNKYNTKLANSPTPTEASGYGKDIQSKLYGTEIRNLLSDLPDNTGDVIANLLTDHFFKDFYNRKVLTTAQREKYEFIALVTLNVEFQIKAHAKGSLKAGNSESDLILLLISMLPYLGFPLVINSVQKVHSAALDLKKEDNK